MLNAVVRRKVGEIQERIAQAEEAIHRDRIALSVLEELLEEADAEQFDESEETEGEKNGQPMKPVAAVLSLLRQYPGGLRRSEILESLENNVQSDAKNVRHMLRTTLHNLTQSGRLDLDEMNGVYRLAKIDASDGIK